MLSAKITKFAITGGYGNEWKTHPVEEASSSIVLARTPTEISVTITVTGPMIIRLIHNDQYPLKVYTRQTDLAIKFWSVSESCWRKVQVTLLNRLEVLMWAQKLREFGMTVVNKDQIYRNNEESQVLESQMLESQVQPSLTIQQQPILPTLLKPSSERPPTVHVGEAYNPKVDRLTVKELSSVELRAAVLSCLNRPDFVELLEKINQIL